MNHETTDFARFRFTQRISAGPQNAFAIERFRRQRNRIGARAELVMAIFIFGFALGFLARGG